VNAQSKVKREDAGPLEGLRVPFPAHQISKLPKGGVMLDYVGHAALTDRLLDVDPMWSWEPLAYDQNGLPAYDPNGGLWIRLTVCGVTRLGYGHAGTKKGGDAVKEVIGDALRNAAMRFGAALDLWHKGDLHADDEQAGGHSEEREVSPQPVKREVWDAPIKNKSALHKALNALDRELAGCGDSDMVYGITSTQEWRDFVTTAEQYAPHYLRGGEPAPPEFEGLLTKAERMVREFDSATATHMADLARV